MVDEKTLRELYLNQELTVKEISERLDLSVGTIFNYLKKYGIVRGKYTQRSKEKMSNSLKGRPSARKGVKLSEETKRKISEAQRGHFRNPSNYGGHRKKRTDGYIEVYCPEHPYATKDGYVMEHILVMENAISRYITRDEVVHHKNKIRDDNRLENLELMTFKAHSALHLKERWAKKKEENKNAQ